MRLQLIESTQSAFYDYYLAYRAIEVNEESLRLLRKYRKNARDRYETAVDKEKAPLQDALQAAVEIGREQDRRLELDQMREIAIARINTLMHLPPDTPLPPPPERIQLTVDLPDVQALRAIALAQRPDLQAVANRIAAEQAALSLAYKEYYPDFEPYFMYDRFMGNMPDNRDLATQVGIRLNVPLYRKRRNAAVAEAEARISEREAELARLTDQVNFQVQEAYAQVQRSARSVRLYQETILKAAEDNAKAAEEAYSVLKNIPFLSLIEAERNVVSLRDRYYVTVAEYFRRLAALERAVGGPITIAPSAVKPDRPPKDSK
jgi:outer membrane protein TolC